MEYITVRRIMDRLLDNPNMKTLKLSSAAAYIKDLCSILNIAPVLGVKFQYLTIEDYKVEIPAEFLDVEKVYLCDDDWLDNALFENNSLNASLDDSMIRESDKTEYGEYVIRNNVLFVDIEETKVEIKGTTINVDDIGFPLIPYDGSLMEAVTNWIKYKHYTILNESGVIADKFPAKAHREYTWYIGQYTSKVDMLSYDEAVSVAHGWQRLLDTRNRNTRGRGLPQFVVGPNFKNRR